MTKLLYLEDWNQLSGEAQVTQVTQYRGKPAIVLDQTIFYPQGGGQPWDTGNIIDEPYGSSMITEVRFENGIVYHMGTLAEGIKAGDTVTMNVDADRRQLHSRLHSGGHILDMAVYSLGLDWIPGKGYHFPEGPYIEYAGTIGEVDKEKLKADIEAAANEFVAENRPVTIRFMPKEKMHEVCHHVPDYLPEGKPGRVVMYGGDLEGLPSDDSRSEFERDASGKNSAIPVGSDEFSSAAAQPNSTAKRGSQHSLDRPFGVPCGGTHVNHLGEIKQLIVRKIRQDKKMIRVAYDVSR